MICTESLHVRINRILLLMVGLWPYQQSKLVRIQLIIFLGILISCIIFQFTAFLTSECTSKLFINVFSSTLFYSTFLLKYGSFSINTEIIKSLLEQLQHIYNGLIDKNEITIIRKYGRYAECCTIFSISASIILLSTLILYPFSPHILDVLLPLNESRSSRSSLLLVTEYFVDQEKYFYLILFHTNAAFSIGCIAMVATGMILVVYILHACGMFRIASYRIEQAITTDISEKNITENKNMIYKKLVYAVDMHRKAMQFSDSSITNFKVMFFFMIVIGVICGSLNFFRAVLFGYGFEELSLPILYVIIHFTYMLIGNFIAQEVTDHNNDVFVSVYSISWYLAPLRVQKMILFLLQRSVKGFNINIGGLYVASLEHAATLLSTSVSYFTVLYSVSK